MRLLIAEDNPILRELNQEWMTAWNFQYDAAVNGTQAVHYATLGHAEYDLCLMDVEMPQLNGIEATRIIRQRLPYFPILGFTSDPAYENECLQAGMDAFLKKPCHAQELLELIEDLAVKSTAVRFRDDGISIHKEKPMTPDELQELRTLKQQGLTKLKLIGLGQTFVVHKNIQNKISHDLVGAGKELSEFIDRSPDEPGRCHLYKANLHVTKDIFLPDEFAEAVRREDEIALRFSGVVDKKFAE